MWACMEGVNEDVEGRLRVEDGRGEEGSGMWRCWGKGLCSMLPQVLFAVAGTTTSIRENKEPSFVKLGPFTNFE